MNIREMGFYGCEIDKIELIIIAFYHFVKHNNVDGLFDDGWMEIEAKYY